MNIGKLIKTLQKQEKIKIVEPSEEICQSYREKSKNSIRAGKILLKEGLIEESISMSYYGMYNELLGLLYKTGIKSENHFFSIYALKEIFGFDNKDILFAKKERINKQYYSNSGLSEREAKEMAVLAENFIEDLEIFMDKISLDDIEEYREMFLRMLG